MIIFIFGVGRNHLPSALLGGQNMQSHVQPPDLVSAGVGLAPGGARPHSYTEAAGMFPAIWVLHPMAYPFTGKVAWGDNLVFLFFVFVSVVSVTLGFLFLG